MKHTQKPDIKEKGFVPGVINYSSATKVLPPAAVSTKNVRRRIWIVPRDVTVTDRGTKVHLDHSLTTANQFDFHLMHARLKLWDPRKDATKCSSFVHPCNVTCRASALLTLRAPRLFTAGCHFCVLICEYLWIVNIAQRKKNSKVNLMGICKLLFSSTPERFTYKHEPPPPRAAPAVISRLKQLFQFTCVLLRW